MDGVPRGGGKEITSYDAMPMSFVPRTWRWAGIFLLALFAFAVRPAAAQWVLEDVADKNRYGAGHIVLPYVFYSPSQRFGGGLIWFSEGLIQPQSDATILAFGNLSETYGIEGSTDDLQIEPIDRLFLSTEFGIFRYNYDKIYVNGNPFFPRQSAGTNDSTAENFISRRHNDDWAHFEFKYLLPIGGGRQTIINKYMMKDGLMQSGATGGYGWNPLQTGRTYLTFTPFFDYQTIEDPDRDLHLNENGLRFGVVYDNSDFPLNPSSGNITRFIVSRDFGLFDTANPWTSLSGEFTQYLNLGHSTWFRQQVIAADLWTSYSPSWKQDIVGGQRVVHDGPPFYDGGTLGGDTRFRGYLDNRFWGRAAIYGSLELRLIPEWNPFAKIALLKQADLAWMQWVVFIEGGRVAPDFNADIFSHLKFDAGFGLRILANDTLIRIDVAASNEAFGVWARLNQPF